MCVSCHGRPDPDFPSTLALAVEPGSCGGCHMELENADASWVQDIDKEVLLCVLGADPSSAGAAGAAREALESELKSRGFRLDGGDPSVWARLTVKSTAARDARFLPPGTSVRIVEIEAGAGDPAEPEPVFRRLAVSRPEYSSDAGQAAALAARDAVRVLSPHLLEALGSIGGR